jgi:hypothetical protein
MEIEFQRLIEDISPESKITAAGDSINDLDHLNTYTIEKGIFYPMR